MYIGYISENVLLYNIGYISENVLLYNIGYISEKVQCIIIYI